jgi:hypothetical protein
MSAVRPASPGKTRTCPHCKAVILESASVCPGCQHHLRFGSDAGPKVEARTALFIEGKIKHPPEEDPWEYSVVVFIRNERDEEVARHVINVGALGRGAQRTVSLAVEVMPPQPVTIPAPKQVSTAPAAATRAPLAPPPAAAAAPRAPTPPVGSSKPLPPAKETLSPPRPGDPPYKPPFGGGGGRR